MKLTYLFVKNFASFGPDGATLDGLGPVNALIGLNNAGKSNLFRASAVLLRVMKVPAQAATSELQGYWHQGNMAEDVELAMGVEFLEGELASLGIGQPAGQRSEHQIACRLYWPSTESNVMTMERLIAPHSNESLSIPVDSPINLLDSAVQQRLLHVPAERRIQPESIQNITTGTIGTSFDGRVLRNWLMKFVSRRSAAEQQQVEEFKEDLRSIPGFERVDFQTTINHENNQVMLLVSDGPS